MKVINKTKYQFDFTKTFNEVPDNSTYSFQSNRRMDIYQRLYYEYTYTNSINGLVFFWTLTYNNKHIPVYLIPQSSFRWFTHSYDDIRYVTNGSLSKWLSRSFNCNLKYFCAPELGDGKGKRGKGNNPHYHFIFFIQPNCFSLPSPKEFADKIKEIWQGSSSFINFQSAKFGCCQPGNNNGVVNSTTALKYVSKYVIKDVATSKQEKSIEMAWRSYFKESFLTPNLVFRFYRYVVNSSDYPFIRDKYSFYSFMKLDYYSSLRKNKPSLSYKQFLLNAYVLTDKELFEHCRYIYNLLYEYFISTYYELLVSNKMKDYFNKYSPKVRYSQGLGISGLNYVKDVDSNPHFVIPDKNNYLSIPISLYYKRKLFYDVFKDENNNTLYRLNKRGVALYVHQLPFRIDSFVQRIKSYCTSSYNTNHISPTDSDLRIYAIYKLVYEFRSYASGDSLCINSHYDINDVAKDYKHFISYSVLMSNYSLVPFMSNLCDCKRISFSSHPLFIDYLPLFNQLDSLSTEVSRCLDDIKRNDYLKRRETRSKLLRNKFNNN